MVSIALFYRAIKNQAEFGVRVKDLVQSGEDEALDTSESAAKSTLDWELVSFIAADLDNKSATPIAQPPSLKPGDKMNLKGPMKVTCHTVQEDNNEQAGPSQMPKPSSCNI